MKKVILASTAAIMLSVSGCATIVKGTTQSVSVSTLPESGATCKLTNNKGSWYVNSTPGSVMVNKGAQMFIDCNKQELKGSTVIDPSIEPWTFGNALFGLLGLIGIIVDASNGANMTYGNNDTQVEIKK